MISIIDQNGISTTYCSEDELTQRWSNVVVDETILNKLSDWLGKDGWEFFYSLWVKYHSVIPVYVEGGIPHPVHFREGMQVRNFLRDLPECSEWTHDQFENDYVVYLEKSITRPFVSKD